MIFSETEKDSPQNILSLTQDVEMAFGLSRRIATIKWIIL